MVHFDENCLGVFLAHGFVSCTHAETESDSVRQNFRRKSVQPGFCAYIKIPCIIEFLERPVECVLRLLISYLLLVKTAACKRVFVKNRADSCFSLIEAFRIDEVDCSSESVFFYIYIVESRMDFCSVLRIAFIAVVAYFRARNNRKCNEDCRKKCKNLFHR